MRPMINRSEVSRTAGRIHGLSHDLRNKCCDRQTTIWDQLVGWTQTPPILEYTTTERGHKCAEARRRGKVESDGEDQGFTRPIKRDGWKRRGGG